MNNYWDQLLLIYNLSDILMQGYDALKESDRVAARWKWSRKFMQDHQQVFLSRPSDEALVRVTSVDGATGFVYFLEIVKTYDRASLNKGPKVMGALMNKAVIKAFWNLQT